jgi:glycosyltransferase involved in cell wall biosynthesis
VADGQSGRLVPVGDAAAFALAVTRLLDDPTERQRLSAGARRLIAQHHDEGVAARALAAALRRLR